MLGPDYLDRLPDALTALWQQAEDDILLDVARRLRKTGLLTETAAYQAARLEAVRTLQRDITGILARYSGRSWAEIRRMLTEAGTRTLDGDDEIHRLAGNAPAPVNESPALLNLLNAGYRQTLGSWQNLTATTATTVTGEFEARLDRAWLQVSSGAFDYNTAIRRAVDDLADGMKYVAYPSGHNDTLEVAVRRCVLTGVNQTAGKLQLARMEEMDCAFVEVTAHEGARPSHAAWQGKIYHRGGEVVQDGVRYADFETATGYGTGPGLCGWNCRHNFYPFYPGISTPNYTPEKLKALNARDVPYHGGLYTKYEISQMQRALERKVRKYKRRYLAESEAGLDARDTAAKLKAARQQLAEFIRDTGGKPDSARTAVQGFGRSAGSKAAWAAKRLQDASAHAILEENSSSGYKEITMQSIQRIQPFACETLDAAGSRALANAHKKLLLEARKVPLGIEKARCYGLDMQPISGYFTGIKSGNVHIPGFHEPHIAIHNHPSGLTFSPGDILGFASRNSMQMLTIVGNDGSVYALEKTAATNSELLKKAALELHDATNVPTLTPQSKINLVTNFLEGVAQYGVNYYAGRD